MMEINEVTNDELISYENFELSSKTHNTELNAENFISAYVNAFTKFNNLTEDQKPFFQTFREVGNFPKEALALMRAFSRIVIHYPRYSVDTFRVVVNDLKINRSIDSATKLFYDLLMNRGFRTDI